MSGDGELTGRIVSKVGDREGVPEEELPPLYDVIEPEALEKLVDHTRKTSGADLRVQFRYAGYTVVIGDSGDITVGK